MTEARILSPEAGFWASFALLVVFVVLGTLLGIIRSRQAWVIEPSTERLTLRKPRRTSVLDFLCWLSLALAALWWAPFILRTPPFWQLLFGGGIVVAGLVEFYRLTRPGRWVFDKDLDQFRHGRTLLAPLSAIEAVFIRSLYESPDELALRYRSPTGKERTITIDANSQHLRELRAEGRRRPAPTSHPGLSSSLRPRLPVHQLGLRAALSRSRNRPIHGFRR